MDGGIPAELLRPEPLSLDLGNMTFSRKPGVFVVPEISLHVKIRPECTHWFNKLAVRTAQGVEKT